MFCENYEQYGFYVDQQSALVEIQEAFGLIVNHETHIVEGTSANLDYNNPAVISASTGINPDMQQWWENLRKSRSQTESIMNRMYEYYQKFVDPTIDEDFFNSYEARLWRWHYYWER